MVGQYRIRPLPVPLLGKELECSEGMEAQELPPRRGKGDAHVRFRRHYLGGTEDQYASPPLRTAGEGQGGGKLWRQLSNHAH